MYMSEDLMNVIITAFIFYTLIFSIFPLIINSSVSKGIKVRENSQSKSNVIGYFISVIISILISLVSIRILMQPIEAYFKMSSYYKTTEDNVAIALVIGEAISSVLIIIWAIRIIVRLTSVFSTLDNNKKIVYCPTCGIATPYNSAFCFECGNRLTAPAFTPAPAPTATACCPNCGKPARANTAFCTACGTKLAPSAPENTLCCPNCGKAAPVDTVFCAACGTKLAPSAPENTLCCPNCGKTAPVDTVFCTACGTKLTK